MHLRQRLSAGASLSRHRREMKRHDGPTIRALGARPRTIPAADRAPAQLQACRAEAPSAAKERRRTRVWLPPRAAKRRPLAGTALRGPTAWDARASRSRPSPAPDHRTPDVAIIGPRRPRPKDTTDRAAQARTFRLFAGAHRLPMLRPTLRIPVAA